MYDINYSNFTLGQLKDFTNQLGNNSIMGVALLFTQQHLHGPISNILNLITYTN